MDEAPAPGMGYDGNYSNGAPEFSGGAGDYDMSDKTEGVVDGGLDQGITERKRIQYVTIDMESLEFDRTVSELKSRASAVGGYIDSSRETGQSIYGKGARSAELVLRIPADALDGFTGGVASLGSVLSQYTSTEDVTDSYFDTEARLASLKLQRDKYMELLEQADSMDYIIQLTNALTDVTYQIERYTGTLNKYDSLITYSTVTIRVNEVVKLTEEPKVDPTFGDRISDAFSDSIGAFAAMCQGLVIALVSMAPFLVIPAIIAVVVIVIINGKMKKRRRTQKAEVSGGSETK